MNPGYGIIMWVIVGALAGWIGSKITGTDARRGGVGNVIVGVMGAIVGGFVTRFFFGDNPGTNGLIASVFVALLAACLVIVTWKRLDTRTV